MKYLVLAILSIFILDLVFSSCANPGSPTGGPKDTIPPALINSYPLNGSINFSGLEVTLEFSEYVTADKLTTNLIITPQTDIKFKHLIKKNQLSIKFEEALPDSTTLSLNFFDGVTDITEKNPAVNLVLAFSTGSFIDSISVSGSVYDLFTQKPSDKFVVGLYPLSDSLDFLAHSPMYFTTTTDSGLFVMSYIKSGFYKILSFNDQNKNLLLDPEEEAHAFLVDTLNLSTSLDHLELRTLLQNVKPLQLINNRPVGSYHEIKFNKTIDSYQLSPDTLYTSLEGDNKDIIRLYNKGQFNFGDSIPLIVSASDSLFNSVQDTLKIVFLESKRKPKELASSITFNEKSLIDNPTYQLTFSKPIIHLDTTKLIYQADSLFSYQPDSLQLIWNSTNTNLELTTYLSKDSLYARYDSIFKQDTTATDTTLTQPTDSLPPSRSTKKKSIRKPKLDFSTLKGAFISIEGDTSKLETITHKRSSTSTFGTLKLKIETEEPSFTVQLLTKSGQLKYQSKNDKNPIFTVDPTTYQVRILIDTNQDGIWSYGNLLRNEEPEKIYLFPDEIPVRENWIVEDYVISF